MSMTAAVATFLAVLPAELPDKTIMACLILSSRYQPLVVFSGAAAAFATQVVLAVSVGGVLSVAPHHLVTAFAAVAFAGGAVLLWWQDRAGGRSAEEGETVTSRLGSRSGAPAAFAATFALVFLAEFGDLTQLLTISLAARFHSPVAVGIGATLALWVAAAAAVTLGWRLLKLVPMHWMTRGAAVVMLVLAGTSAYASIT